MRTHVEQVKKEMSSKISGTGLLSIRAKNGTEETKTESFPWPFFRKKNRGPHISCVLKRSIFLLGRRFSKIIRFYSVERNFSFRNCESDRNKISKVLHFFPPAVNEASPHIWRAKVHRVPSHLSISETRL